MRDHLPWRGPQRGPHLHLCPPPGCCHPSSHNHMVLRESDQVTFFVRKPPVVLHCTQRKSHVLPTVYTALCSRSVSVLLSSSDHTGRSHTAGVPLPEDFVPKRGHIKGGLGEADQDGCQQRPVPVSLPRHSRALGPPQTTRAGLHCVF